MYDGYEESLATELYGIHKNMGISFTELYDMPVMYRRDLIRIHNKLVEEETRRKGRCLLPKRDTN